MTALPELVPVLFRFDRTRVDGDLATGAVTLQTKPLPRNVIARLETISVVGGAAALGGARVTLYIGDAASDGANDDDGFATALLGATDPLASFGGGDRPWLYGGEILTCAVTGGGTGRVAMRVWARHYRLDMRETDDPRPVQVVGPVATVHHDQEPVG